MVGVYTEDELSEALQFAVGNPMEQGDLDEWAEALVALGPTKDKEQQSRRRSLYNQLCQLETRNQLTLSFTEDGWRALNAMGVEYPFFQRAKDVFRNLKGEKHEFRYVMNSEVSEDEKEGDGELVEISLTGEDQAIVAGVPSMVREGQSALNQSHRGSQAAQEQKSQLNALCDQLKEYWDLCFMSSPTKIDGQKCKEMQFFCQISPDNLEKIHAEMHGDDEQYAHYYQVKEAFVELFRSALDVIGWIASNIQAGACQAVDQLSNLMEVLDSKCQALANVLKGENSADHIID